MLVSAGAAVTKERLVDLGCIDRKWLVLGGVSAKTTAVLVPILILCFPNAVPDSPVTIDLVVQRYRSAGAIVREFRMPNGFLGESRSFRGKCFSRMSETG